MKKEYIIDNLQNSKKKYRSELLDFIHFYIKAVEKLHCKVFEKGCSDREKYLIKRLEYWLEESGYILFSDTIQQLQDIDEERIRGVIDVYQFLLSNSMDRAEKLIDQLFHIPNEFFHEFMGEKRTLVGKIDGCKEAVLENNDIVYIVAELGIFRDSFLCA